MYVALPHVRTLPRSPTIQWLKDILASKEEERAGSEVARPPALPGPPPAPIGPKNGPVDGSEAVAPMGEGGSSAGPGEGDHGPPRTDARVFPPVPPFEASVVLSLCDFKMLFDQPLPGWGRQPNSCCYPGP